MTLSEAWIRIAPEGGPHLEFGSAFDDRAVYQAQTPWPKANSPSHMSTPREVLWMHR